MKKIICLLFVFGFFALVKAQVAINTNGSDPDPSAMLDIQSSEKGLLIPRMTATERDNISSPATGLTVYVTDDNTFYYYNGTEWVANNHDNDWKVNGTDMYAIPTGNVGIGTTTPSEKLVVGPDVGSVGGGTWVSISHPGDYPGLALVNSNDSYSYMLWQNSLSLIRFGIRTPSRFFETFGIAPGKVEIGDDRSPDAMLEIAYNSIYPSDYFFVSSDKDNDGDVFAIKSSGDVGIGTSDPQKKLDVNGDVRHGNNLFIYSQSESGSTAWARFNAPQTHGSNIFIGAGGTTMIGAGESATTTINGIDTTDAHEMLYLTSDHDIKLVTHLQSNDWDDRIEAMVLQDDRILSLDFISLRLHDITSDSNSVSFIRRTQNFYYGYGMSINPGQGLVVGAGESANKLFVNVALDSTETLFLTSDVQNNSQAIKFITSLQNDWDDRIEAMTILGNGKIGIGLNNPTGYLHLAYRNDAGPNGSSDPGADFMIGNLNGQHLEIDNNEIHSMSDAETGAVLYINDDGQPVVFGGVIRLKPTSPPDSPQEGMIYYDSNDKVLKCYDGSQWRNLW